MSIDEAYKAREQGASIQRLTVVTVGCLLRSNIQPAYLCANCNIQFIFLPLLFVSVWIPP